jgi:hypothetical protein
MYEVACKQSLRHMKGTESSARLLHCAARHLCTPRVGAEGKAVLRNVCCLGSHLMHVILPYVSCCRVACERIQRCHHFPPVPAHQAFLRTF